MSFIIASAFGSAIASTILFFGLCAFVMQRQRKAKLGWMRGFKLFRIALFANTIVNTVLYLSIPSLLFERSGQEVSMWWTFLQPAIFPLLISGVTLILFWKPDNQRKE